MTTPANGKQQLISVLLFTGFSSCTLAGNTYQWKDRHGQIHFGDNPPQRAETTELRLPRPHPSATSGLRPGEVAALQALELRAERQQQRARAARRHSEQQQAAGRAACKAHREQFHRAPGKDGFKPHARYLRTHCW